MWTLRSGMGSKAVLKKTREGFIKASEKTLESMKERYRILGGAIPKLEAQIEKDKKELNGSH